MKSTLAVLVATALAAPAFADEPVVVFHHRHLAEAPGAQADAWKRWAEDFSNDMRASMGTMFAPRLAGKVVKGAPYTAEAITETTQTLPDGNTISRKKAGLVFRDSEGRTRQELGGDGKTATIHISDPVDGKHVILTPDSHKAVTMPRAKVATHVSGHEKNKQVIRVSGTEVRVEDGKVFVDGKEAAPGKVELTSKAGKKVVVDGGKIFIDGKEISTPRAPHPPHAPGVVQHIETTTSADGTTREEVRVHVVRKDSLAPTPPLPPMPPTPPGAIAPLPPMPPLPGVTTMRFDHAKLGKGVTTNLGTKEFDGVKAEGKSTMWTIAAGEIGNKNPIHVTSESWYSPDLQVTVQSRYSDPRTGETLYRLANIRRTEPAPDLFKVPEGYDVKGRGPKAKG